MICGRTWTGNECRSFAANDPKSIEQRSIENGSIEEGSIEKSQNAADALGELSFRNNQADHEMTRLCEIVKVAGMNRDLLIF